MIKPRFAHKNNGRMAIPVLAAAAMTGTYLYYRQPSNNKATGGQAERTRQKRDKEALGGAGIGGNANTGGHETGQPGSGVQPGTGDVERSSGTTADKDMLPSGGVGGGYGGGNSNSRAVEMSGKSDTKDELKNTAKTMAPSASRTESGQASSSDTSSSSSSSSTGSASRGPDNKGTSGGYSGASGASGDTMGKSSSTSDTGGHSISQRLQGVFGTGGKKSGEPADSQKMYADTKVHSHANQGDVPTKRTKMRSDS